MVTEASTPVHPDFARWYSSVGLGDEETRRKGRWIGVCLIVERAETPMVEALIRLAFKSKQLAQEALVKQVRAIFKEADETFEMQGNDRELQILAGSSLAVLMDSESDSAAYAALAVTTTAFDGARMSDLPMDLVKLAENSLVHIAVANRERPELDSFLADDESELEFDEPSEHVRQNQNFPGVAAAFGMVAETMGNAIKQIAERQTGALQAMDTLIQIQDEELQMLWWLVGQRSKDYKCSFGDLPADAQPLVFASELADATRILPGPPSAPAMLSRAGVKDRKKIAISSAINGADPAWLRQLIGDFNPSPVTMPLHYAIVRQLETGPGDTWLPGWAAATGVGNNLTLPGLTLGTLFYRERLLILLG